MTKWFAGVDAGGTSTHVRVVKKENGLATFVAEGVGGPGNVHDVGADGLVEVVADALRKALSPLGPEVVLKAMTVGAAGVGRPADVDEVTRAMIRAFPGVAIEVGHDAMIALAGGTWGGPGVVIIAGTGSVAWSYAPDGTWKRAGGWGYIIGDEGSGYALGRNAMTAVARAADGRGPQTSLTRTVLQQLGLVQPMDMIPFVHEGPFSKRPVAGLAPFVLKAAEEGDAVADQIVTDALSHLVELVKAVAHVHPPVTPCPLVTVGGLFNNARFYERFIYQIQASAMSFKTSRPLLDPAGGACIVALKSHFASKDAKQSHAPLDERWKRSLIKSYPVA